MNTAEYLPTSKMAELIGKSKNFLKQRKGIDFHLGTHFFQPNGSADPFWKVEAMIQWIEGSVPINNNLADEIIKSLVG